MVPAPPGRFRRLAAGRGRWLIVGLAFACFVPFFVASGWNPAVPGAVEAVDPGGAAWTPGPAGPEPRDRIDDRAFWRMFTEFSEPNGFFRSDNFVSNELTFQQVIPALKAQAGEGAYLGVGPEQNFTYLVALRPRIAFIVDVRRQNALLHLLYKALVELSADRAEFLSRLFSRPRPRGLNGRSDVSALFAAYAGITPSADLHRTHLRAVVARLVEHHHFPLTRDDLATIEYVYDAFYSGGPDITYSFPRGRGWRPFPTYADLMLATDGAGENQSYLATEERFQALRALEQHNLVIPVVGDFAGDTALRAVARYLGARRMPVAAFYTSNVEFYLFQSDRWKTFVDNVATLPLDGRSTFIRAAFRGFTPGYGRGGLNRTLLDPMADLVAAVRDARVQSYRDLLERSRY